MTEDTSHNSSGDEIPIDANGPAYTLSEQRQGVPLIYIAEKLGSAIEELHSYACTNSGERDGLVPTMYYLLVAHLGMHNMLGATNDRTLPARLLKGSRDELGAWLRLVEREGDVQGLASL